MATHSLFLPGESHGQRSLLGYSPRGRKESHTAEWLKLSLSLFRGLESSSSHFLACPGTNLEWLYEDQCSRVLHNIGSLGMEKEQWQVADCTHKCVGVCKYVCVCVRVCTEQNNGNNWHETLNYSINF